MAIHEHHVAIYQVRSAAVPVALGRLEAGARNPLQLWNAGSPCIVGAAPRRDIR